VGFAWIGIFVFPRGVQEQKDFNRITFVRFDSFLKVDDGGILGNAGQGAEQ
jgi:hypothetical protein